MSGRDSYGAGGAGGKPGSDQSGPGGSASGEPGAPGSAHDFGPGGVYNIVIAGVGGQGIILAAKLLAQAALDGGGFVRSAETIGMAQRGGSVTAHLRIAKAAQRLHSPLVPSGQAQMIIGFDPAETVRALTFAGPGTALIYSDTAVVPPACALAGESYDGSHECRYLQSLSLSGAMRSVNALNSQKLLAHTGSDKALNVALLGVACQKAVPFVDSAGLRRALEKTTKRQYLDMNLKALDFGGKQCR
jgi:indolepyruvate ferredoxin oxidoreductase beta subunit